MNDIYVYFIRTYEKKISHNYYYQIVAHEICDDGGIMLNGNIWYNITSFWQANQLQFPNIKFIIIFIYRNIINDK